MTLDLLDILLVLNVCFDKPVPWWLWCLGVLATISNNLHMAKMRKVNK